jgi:pimeloyl-ACP methyl ester carboxylesterase
MARAGLLAGARLQEIEALARARVREGRGNDLLQVPGWWYVVSAASYVDWLDNVPDTLALAPQIRCPVLCMRGDEEPADTYPAEEFARRAGGPCEVEIIPGCNHFYVGREPAVRQRVAAWLSKLQGDKA